MFICLVLRREYSERVKLEAGVYVSEKEKERRRERDKEGGRVIENMRFLIRQEGI